MDKPWITKGIETACKKKNVLYRKFIKLRTTEAENKYKVYKNKLISVMRQSKKEYYHKLLEQNKSNTQGIWKVLNNIIKKGGARVEIPNYFVKDNNRTVSKTIDIANEFNNYYVNVGNNLANEIAEQKNGTETLKIGDTMQSNLHSIFLTSIEEKEIIDIVKKCKNKKSADWLGIDMMLVKHIIHCIVKPLTYICNLSFQTGIFRNSMKTAKVIPIYKNGDRHSFTNYRPISLLPQFSKILEKLFVCRLDTFIEKHNILCDQQYGFRENRSTSMAVMSLTEQIATAINNKEYTAGVFIDLKKAFDTIHHEQLLMKLKYYGIRGVAHSWLKSYLEDRFQYVQINNEKSNMQKVKCGVPQGSVLGPKLFILYINDICKVSELLNFVLFADDTNLFCHGKNLNELLKTMEGELNRLKIWFDINKLSLNINKTKLMIFGNQKIDDEITLRINNVPIERVYEYKFLGVIIDHRLSWKSHINLVKRKMSKTTAIIYRSREILNQNSLYLLYCSLIIPYMTYCVEIWGNTYRTNLNPIFILQKRVIRTIKKVDYYEPTNPLFINLFTLKFWDIVDLQTLLILYKAHNNLLPTCLQSLFEIKENKQN